MERHVGVAAARRMSGRAVEGRVKTELRRAVDIHMDEPLTSLLSLLDFREECTPGREIADHLSLTDGLLRNNLRPEPLAVSVAHPLEEPSETVVAHDLVPGAAAHHPNSHGLTVQAFGRHVARPVDASVSGRGTKQARAQGRVRPQDVQRLRHVEVRPVGHRRPRSDVTVESEAKEPRIVKDNIICKQCHIHN